jgi:hypothetical protein
MSRVLKVAVAVCLVLGVAGAADAASVKTKKGTLVEGEITGLVVQKGDLSTSVKDGKTSFAATYHLSNGGEIASIDEAGVTKRGASVAFCSVSQDDKAPDDVDAVETCVNMPAGAFFGGYTKGGGHVVRLGGTSAKGGMPNADAVLGEFRKEAGKGRIIPSLTLKTATGETTIPVTDIVAFKH